MVVTAVPIVVESTAEEYFVLYVEHDLDGATVEIPVLVKRGATGTTPLAENVAGNSDTNTTTVTAAKTVGRPADKAARRPRRVRPHLGQAAENMLGRQ